jgi:citrate synthase
MLESEEAARRLGVKVTTLYAYVSRGMLVSHPSADRRRSLFDVDDVEQLAQRSRGAKRVESRLATVTTAITQLRDDGPAYRGQPVASLALAAPFEDVAELLWGTGPAPWEPVALGPVPELSVPDLFCWAVIMAGAREPLPSDQRLESVARSARRFIATMIETLPRRGATAPPLRTSDGTTRPGSVAGHLAARLATDPSAALVGAVNAALVLLADHELATSTVAVRVAASTRGALSDALLAGLGTLAGPLHGGASQLAYAMLSEAERHGVGRALDDTLRWQRILPGFGHTVYKRGDPRVAILMECFEQLATPEQRRLVRSLIELAADHDIPPPNVDLGLAALTWSAQMLPESGRTIFAVARTAGWTAHYLEELGERPLRFRARAVYASGG